MPFEYWLCGWRVQSEISLPELLPWIDGDRRAPDLSIRIGSIPALAGDITFHTPNVQLSSAGDCRLSIPDVARYAIDLEGREVIVESLRHELPDAARGYLLTTVFGILCHKRGLLPLHASCVLMDGKAVAFAGPSGSGKSTLAAALVKQGCTLIADDVAVIDASDPERPVVRPAFPRLKLWREALASLDLPIDGLEQGRTGADRFRLPTPAFDRHAAALSAIYVLHWTDDGASEDPSAEIVRLTGLRAVRELRNVVYRDALGEAIVGHQRLLAHVGQLSGQVPTYAWGRRVSLDRLASGVGDVLARHASG